MKLSYRVTGQFETGREEVGVNEGEQLPLVIADTHAPLHPTPPRAAQR